MKWTAFDQQTAAALAQHVENVEVSQTAGDELDSALDLAVAGQSAAVLAPADAKGEALLLTLRRKDVAPASSSPAEPDSYRAGGFLGLADEPVYEEKDRNRR